MRRPQTVRRGRVSGVLVGLVLLASSATAQVPVFTGDTAPGAPVTMGGQIRQQYERFVDEEWGAESPDPDGYWLQRYMWHVDAHVWRRLRVYGELKSGLAFGRTGGPRPPDEDRLDVHQAFVDVSHGGVTWRLGRQELAFGSQRLVSVREGPNVRQAFDAASVMVTRGRWQIQGFGGSAVPTTRGVFDDAPDRGRMLWGAYMARSDDSRRRGLDVYYLGYRRTRAVFDQGQGREVRHSWGARLWRSTDALDYDVEAVAQLGRFADSDIRAWTLASDVGHRIGTPAGRVRLGLRADVSSGDRDRHDGRLETFNPLFPRGAYFGLIAPAGPSNHRDLHPQASLTIRDSLVVTTGWLMFWRWHADDGIYGLTGNLLRSSSGTRSRFVGHSPGIEAEWQIGEHLALTVDAALFTAGPFIEESGPARSIRFIAAWTTYRF